MLLTPSLGISLISTNTSVGHEPQPLLSFVIFFSPKCYFLFWKGVYHAFMSVCVSCGYIWTFWSWIHLDAVCSTNNWLNFQRVQVHQKPHSVSDYKVPRQLLHSSWKYSSHFSLPMIYSQFSRKHSTKQMVTYQPYVRECNPRELFVMKKEKYGKEGQRTSAWRYWPN